MSQGTLSRSSLIRIMGFSFAIVIALIGSCIYFYQQSKHYKLALENTYQHSLQDLNVYLDNIYSNLNKEQYINSPYQLSNVAADLLSDCRAAKVCLSSLPTADLHLDKTYKFLSQVAAYSSALNKKYHRGYRLSNEDYKLLKQLTSYAKSLNDWVSDIEYKIVSNNYAINEIKHFNNGSAQNKNVKSLINMASIENNFQNYPELMYDGPFSDHILNKKPELTNGKPQISVEQAKKIAALATGVNETQLSHAEDELSTIPLYCFTNDKVTVGITKHGGYICYMIKSRQIKEKNIDIGVAIQNAKQYLNSVLKIPEIQHSYQETVNNYCTINFAPLENDIILYNDLIKVSVALDNGEIISVDAREYINNHRTRNIPTIKQTPEQAMKMISKHLTIIKSPQLAIIPTAGGNEILTYEFICRDDNNNIVLVYINSNTLEEEKILILRDTGQGILTT